MISLSVTVGIPVPALIIVAACAIHSWSLRYLSSFSLRSLTIACFCLISPCRSISCLSRENRYKKAASAIVSVRITTKRPNVSAHFIKLSKKLCFLPRKRLMAGLIPQFSLGEFYAFVKENLFNRFRNRCFFLK